MKFPVLRILFCYLICVLGVMCHSPKDVQEQSHDDEESIPLLNIKADEPADKEKTKKKPEYGPSKWERNDWQNQSLQESSRSVSPASNISHTSYETVETEDQIVGHTPDQFADLEQNPNVSVLCYHHNFSGKNTYDGFNVTPDAFEKQLAYLKQNHYQSISLEQYSNFLDKKITRLPKRPIILSFDDGIRSNLSVVLPLLKKYNFRAVLFIYPGIISANKKNYLNWEELRQLAKSDYIEIGSHSLNHPRLPEHSNKEIHRQLSQSKKILEQKLGRNVIGFAYPFGIYDRRVIQAVKDTGYKLAFTIHSGSNPVNMDKYTLNRFMVTHAHSLGSFANNLKIKSYSFAKLEPKTGSRVSNGQLIQFNTTGFQNIQVKLGKRTLNKTQTNNSVSFQLPVIKSRLGYIPLVIRATDLQGNSIYREMLYLDAKRFPL